MGNGHKYFSASANANQISKGMGMGYGSSLPMSGYYHQMGPMSQVFIMMIVVMHSYFVMVKVVL